MRTIEWKNGTVITIDQTKLPNETVTLKIKTVEEMAEAIKTLRIRGAPLLGAAAAFGVALAAYNSKTQNKEELLAELEDAGAVIKRQRPTAVNLFWGVDRVFKKAHEFSGSTDELRALVIAEAQKILEEDAEQNRAIGRNGAVLIKDGDTILTHCNAGELATVEYGTALGVITGCLGTRQKNQGYC